MTSADEAASSELGDDEWVLRRIRLGTVTMEEGRPRVSSACFSDKGGAMSAVHEGGILADGQPIESVVAGKWRGYGLARLRVGDLKELGLTAKLESGEDDEPHHVNVYGNKTKGTKRRLAKLAARELILLPEDAR